VSVEESHFKARRCLPDGFLCLRLSAHAVGILHTAADRLGNVAGLPRWLSLHLCHRLVAGSRYTASNSVGNDAFRNGSIPAAQCTGSICNYRYIGGGFEVACRREHQSAVRLTPYTLYTHAVCPDFYLGIGSSIRCLDHTVEIQVVD